MNDTTAAGLSFGCTYCDGFHANSRCPRVKAFEYGENGAVTRVEFWSPSEKMKVDLMQRINEMVDDIGEKLG